MAKYKGQDTLEYKIQDDQYQFPYHYIPHLENGVGKKFRVNHNGYEYLCYTKHVEEIIKSFSPHSILEVGCGDGRIIGNLNEIPNRIGVDLSEKAILLAKAFNPEVQFEVIDASEIDEVFDIVFAVEVLEHIPDDNIEHFLKTLADKTKDKGHVIISVPSVVKPLIEKHFRHYDIDLFKHQLEMSGASLEIKNVEYIYWESKFIKRYQRLTHNKYWLFEMNSWQPKIWRHVWKKLRFGTPENGTHLVVTLQKS